MLLIGKCCVAVLKCETTFLLLTTLLPVNIYLVIIWSKESTHTLCLQRHIEQIVLTKCIVQGKCLTLSCHSSKRNSWICHIWRSEDKVFCLNITILCSQHKVKALIVTTKQSNILLVLWTILNSYIMTDIVFDNSLLYNTTLGTQSQLNLTIFQYNILRLAIQSSIK